ncbi:hypothetical protein psal_cds_116 [Pandoravirus salinus]|uniref:Uncharacterized protein n=1 Tax=Pandoravirus salinus TaxID=1349410 RepID=A0A291ATD3_9VIRU|nr:hypothetical protein psal_cds_116 [Pandoravirus salinus]ATE82120.1 hypothetical protein psal_cds_116 [Pandoravirus salinus]
MKRGGADTMSTGRWITGGMTVAGGLLMVGSLCRAARLGKARNFLRAAILDGRGGSVRAHIPRSAARVLYVDALDVPSAQGPMLGCMPPLIYLVMVDDDEPPRPLFRRSRVVLQDGGTDRSTVLAALSATADKELTDAARLVHQGDWSTAMRICGLDTPLSCANVYRVHEAAVDRAYHLATVDWDSIDPALRNDLGMPPVDPTKPRTGASAVFAFDRLEAADTASHLATSAETTESVEVAG